MNKYILRILILLIVGIIIFIVNKYKLKKSLKDKGLRLIICISLLLIIIVPYDSLFFKFKSVDRYFDYYMPQAEIIKIYEYDSHAFVLYIDDSYSFINLKKNNGYYKHNVISFRNTKLIHYGDYIVQVDEIKDEKVLAIVVNNFFEDNDVKDSLNTDFERIVHNNNYIYIGIINTKYDKNYKLIINDKEYEILKETKLNQFTK